MFDEGVSRWILRLAPLLIVLGWWSSTALATRAPGDPKEAFRKQDVAWAKQINLRRSDLPPGVTWTAYGTGGTGGGGSGGNDVGCPGVRSDNSDLTLTGRALSPFFIDTNRHYVIVSAVWILKTQAQAKKFNDRLAHPIARCGPGLMKSQIGAIKGARLVSFGPHPIAGTSQEWSSFRLVISLPVQGRRMKSFVDFVLGQHGRATAWLLLHGAPTPIPTNVEAGFVRVMAGQMAHPPG
jgi:hypothetical protein